LLVVFLTKKTLFYCEKQIKSVKKCFFTIIINQLKGVGAKININLAPPLGLFFSLGGPAHFLSICTLYMHIYKIGLLLQVVVF